MKWKSSLYQRNINQAGVGPWIKDDMIQKLSEITGKDPKVIEYAWRVVTSNSRPKVCVKTIFIH